MQRESTDAALDSLVNLLITKAPPLVINWLTPLDPLDKETAEKDATNDARLREEFIKKENQIKELEGPPGIFCNVITRLIYVAKSKRAMKRERKAAAEAATSNTTSTDAEPMETEQPVAEPIAEPPKVEEPEPEPATKKTKQVFAKKYEKVPRLFPTKMKKLQPKRNQ